MAREFESFSQYEHTSSPSPGGLEAGNARYNAVKHGLTATTLLPAIVGAETLDRHFQRLSAEWQPKTATEKILVAELARHAAALEFNEKAELAVLRCGADAVSQFQASPGAGGFAEPGDSYLAAAVTSDAADRLTRYRRAHEKAWYQALKQLLALRDRGVAAPRPIRIEPPFPFQDNECRDYLWRRLQAPQFHCPLCGHARGYVLEQRLRWQCAGCDAQIGIRSGTVMEGSPLPLVAWFGAIWQLLQDCETPLNKLSEYLKISRPGTLRRMIGKIRSALDSEQISLLLADLDLVFGAQRPLPSSLPETSVRKCEILQNELPVNKGFRRNTMS